MSNPWQRVERVANTIACTVSDGCSVDVHSGRSLRRNVASEIFVGKMNKDRRKTAEVIVFASKHHSTDRFSHWRIRLPNGYSRFTRSKITRGQCIAKNLCQATFTNPRNFSRFTDYVSLINYVLRSDSYRKSAEVYVERERNTDN